jgi:hypothetical protein
LSAKETKLFGQYADLTQYKIVNELLCPKFNIGLDSFFIQTNTHHRLLESRRILMHLRAIKGTNDKGFTYAFIKSSLSARAKINLLKLAKKTELVTAYPDLKNPKFILFNNETKLLKKLLLSNNSLTNRQIVFNFSIASTYRFKDPVLSMGEMKDQSWSYLVTKFTKGTGQEKMALVLGRSRAYINQTLKHSLKSLDLQNEFVKIGYGVFSSKYSKSLLELNFKAHNLGAYKINHKGEIYRQLPNSYNLSEKSQVLELRNKCFKYSIKKIHKSYLSGSGNSISKNYLNLTKKNGDRNKLLESILDGKRKTTIGGEQVSGRDLNSFMSAERISNIIYENKEGEKKIKFFYEKIVNELRTIKKLDLNTLKLINNNGWLKAPIKIESGLDFKEVTSDTFNEMRESLIKRRDDKYKFYRMIQRQSFEYKKRA